MGAVTRIGGGVGRWPQVRMLNALLRDWCERTAGMGRLMKRVAEAAKSPKAKKLEKEMLRKAKDPAARAKISSRFRKLSKKRS